MLNDLSLSDLFAVADEFDCYLTAEEIEARDEALNEAIAAVMEDIGHACEQE